MELLNYQHQAVDFLVGKSTPQQGALLALAPGLGKTACAIRAAAVANKQHILVVAPLSLLQNWRKEIQQWSPGATVDLAHGELANTQAQWVVTNYDTIRAKSERMRYSWDCIIYDESVLLKNRSTLRTRACSDLALKSKAACRWLLSGGPTTHWLDDMWAQLHLLDRKRFPGYWRFVHQYCIEVMSPWGTKIVGNRPEAMEQLKVDLADMFLSCQQDDVLDLPPFLWEELDVEMLPVQARMYGQMRDEFIAQLSELPENAVLAPSVLAQMTRLIQLASNPALLGGPDVSGKERALYEMLDWVRKPVLVWTAYVATAQRVKAMCEHKGLAVAVLTGDTPTTERQQIVDNFQADSLDVLVAHPGVGKYGLTLTAARTAIYLERTFDGDAYYQSLYRVRRIGTKESPYVVHLRATVPGLEDRAAQTIDHIIGRNLACKTDNVQQLTAGLLLRQLRLGFVLPG